MERDVGVVGAAADGTAQGEFRRARRCDLGAEGGWVHRNQCDGQGWQGANDAFSVWRVVWLMWGLVFSKCEGDGKCQWAELERCTADGGQWTVVEGLM